MRVDVAGPPAVPPVQSDKQKRERLPILSHYLLKRASLDWCRACQMHRGAVQKEEELNLLLLPQFRLLLLRTLLIS